MMSSPEVYVKQFQDATYPELIRERDDLMRFLQEFEKNETAGDRSGEDWEICPTPDVQYQMYLEYVSGLCALMKKRYNEEYVWGDRTLREDMLSAPRERSDE